MIMKIVVYYFCNSQNIRELSQKIKRDFVNNNIFQNAQMCISLNTFISKSFPYLITGILRLGKTNITTRK